MDQPAQGKIRKLGAPGQGKPRILIAPLDWGLGHATRCIPIIRELLESNCDVWLAGEGGQASLLSQEFPGLPMLTLEGYRVRYAKSGPGLTRSLLTQAPAILRAIKKENKWLVEKIKAHAFDAVISDNRYGLHHPSIPCYFITHQLTIKTPWGRWAERFLQKRNYSFIDRFTECWVPDHPGLENLAGDLSHPVRKPDIPVRYIGPLSRFSGKDVEPKKGHLLFLLSGPEPQRGLLENIFTKQVAHYNGTATIVRGLPGSSTIIPSSNMIRFYNHLSSEELNREMHEAEFVIARSGYSSVMDIVALGKKSLLIPTPGQPEQEYLAIHLQEKRIACCFRQKDFSLESALNTATKFNYNHRPTDMKDELTNAVREMIAKLVTT